jgi:lysophospholipase L1-like esterase
MPLRPSFPGIATVLAAALASAAPAHAQPVPAAGCIAPPDLVRLDHPLRRTAQRYSGGMPITIVAVGSSSTEGAGASSPAMSYPSQLAVELKKLWPRADIKVVNRGIGGETATEMLARFDRDVIGEKPDIVVWQVGSNSVLRNQPIAGAGHLIRDGLKRLKDTGADVILMNPQYAPKVFTKPDAERMVDLIDRSANEAKVDLFQRYAVMRYWRLTENIPFEMFLSPDELHMNDWSYGCIARLLAGAIAEAATRPTLTAGARSIRQ